MEQLLAPILVEKEAIQNMTFKKPITFDRNPHIERKISDAMLLSNSYHTKVSIVFCDDEGLKGENNYLGKWEQIHLFERRNVVACGSNLGNRTYIALNFWF